MRMHFTFRTNLLYLGHHFLNLATLTPVTDPEQSQAGILFKFNLIMIGQGCFWNFYSHFFSYLIISNRIC